MNNQRLRLLAKKSKKNKLNQKLIDSILEELSLINIDPNYWDKNQQNLFMFKITDKMNFSINEQLNFEKNYPSIFQKYFKNNQVNESTDTIVVNREDISFPNSILQTIYHFTEKEIKSDGNCFFRCISYIIYKNENEYQNIRNLIEITILEWINSDEIIESIFGPISKKNYILNEFYDGVVDDLRNYQVIGFKNILFQNMDLNNKREFIYFWATIIKLGESDNSRSLLINNLMVKKYEKTINYYFYNSGIKTKNNIVASVFWGSSELLFLISNYFEINFTILFKHLNYLNNNYEWTHKSFIYDNLPNIKNFYLKFTGCHYNVLNLKEKINTKIISQN